MDSPVIELWKNSIRISLFCFPNCQVSKDQVIVIVIVIDHLMQTQNTFPAGGHRIPALYVFQDWWDNYFSMSQIPE